MTKLFVIVISMWGNDGSEWVYMGNQYVYNLPMTLEQCELITNKADWDKYETNQYYMIQMDCKEV